MLAASPVLCFATGFGVFMTLGLIGIRFFGEPDSVGKVLGGFILGLVLAMAAIGAGALSLLTGSRIRLMDPGMTDYRALTNGAAVVFIAALTPVLGTFVLAPVGLLMSIGAGLRSLFVKGEESKPVVVA